MMIFFKPEVSGSSGFVVGQRYCLVTSQTISGGEPLHCALTWSPQNPATHYVFASDVRLWKCPCCAG